MDFLKTVKTLDGVATRSLVGATITVLSTVLILVLLVSEFVVYTSTETVHHMTIDSQLSAQLETVKISLHATFFHLSCDDVQLDLESTRGDAAFGTKEDAVVKVPSGTGGCSVKGHLLVAKVGGNFHVATGKLGSNGPIIQLMGGMFFGGNAMMKGANISHTIHYLNFGDDFPGVTNPLKEVTNIVPMDVGQYQFHIKVVPSVFKPLRGRTVYSNSYSISEQFVRLDLLSSMNTQPGVYFHYDFFPVMVEYREQKPSFLQFFTRVCGIVGGIVTVAGVVDSLMHRANEQLKKKS